MKKLTAWDVCYAAALARGCALSYVVNTALLAPFVDDPDRLLGGMWSVVATVFVFRETRVKAVTAGTDRLFATCVSFALCLVYLLIFPFTGLGMAAVIGLGAVVLMALGREEDIVTTGITSAVVLVVAGMSPEHAWPQPILRLFDTVVGITVGVCCKWSASYVFFRAMGEPAR